MEARENRHVRKNKSSSPDRGGKSNRSNQGGRGGKNNRGTSNGPRSSKGHDGHERRSGRGSSRRSRLDESDLLRLVEGAGSEVLILILDCVQDPHNLGAILRSSEGAGVTAVVAPRDKSVSITETVHRISTGAADLVPFIQVTNLSRTMKDLQSAGIWLTGTSDQGTKNIYDIDFTGPVGIVMGAEGSGLRRLTEETCDNLVQIPMAGKIDCLNVSVATGVCLFECRRQRLTANATE